MTYSAFMQACEGGTLPSSESNLLQSLYEDKRDDWDTAHSIAQQISTKEGSRVHAYLHRKEGDLGNANYWYSRAGEPAPTTDLDTEWDDLARRFTDV